MQTAESIIFGGSINGPPVARLAKAIGRSKSTVWHWKHDDAMRMTLGDFKNLCRVRGLTDTQILQIVKGR